jgi:hypothetical protein
MRKLATEVYPTYFILIGIKKYGFAVFICFSYDPQSVSFERSKRSLYSTSFTAAKMGICTSRKKIM